MSARFNDLVSVIIPSFNYAWFLPQTLSSVLAQTYSQWECIIVDDGSTDDTQQVVSNFVKDDSRIKYIRQENSGQSAARNNGIINAKGAYIQFLDADDLLGKDKISYQVAYLEAHLEVDIVYGNVRYFVESTNEEDLLFSRWGENKPWMPEISGQGEPIIKKLIMGNITEFGCLLFRRTIVEEIGLLDRAIQGVEDWEYCVRCALMNKRFVYVDNPHGRVLMRHHPTSFSKNKVKMLTGAIKVHEKIQRKYNSQLSDELGELNRQCLYGNKKVLGRLLMRTSNLWDGVKLMLEAASVRHDHNDIVKTILKELVVAFKKKVKKTFGS